MSVQNASHAVLEEVATGGVSLWCEECGIKVVAYKGESGRNGFSRGEEHLDNKATKDEEKSILWAHSLHHHNSREDMVYMMWVTGAYNEPLDRQIMERVQISNFQGPVLINRRNEMGGIRIDKIRIFGILENFEKLKKWVLFLIFKCAENARRTRGKYA